MALQDNALLTEAEVRDALKLTATTLPDADAQRLANLVSDRLETETGRRLKSRTYTTEVVSVQASALLGTAWLGTEYPITGLATIQLGGQSQTTWMPGDAGSPDAQDVFVLEAADPKHGRDRLIRPAGWPVGALVTRTYTAGYGAVPAFPIPEDLKDAARMLVRHVYYAQDRQATNVASRSDGAMTITYANVPVPTDIVPILRAYRRWMT